MKDFAVIATLRRGLVWPPEDLGEDDRHRAYLSAAREEAEEARTAAGIRRQLAAAEREADGARRTRHLQWERDPEWRGEEEWRRKGRRG